MATQHRPAGRSGEGMSERELAGSETIDLIGSDKVEGTNVYNRNGDHLGRIEKVMIDKRSGRTSYAVMSFGGFLGIGEEHYPLPWEALDYDTGLGGYRVDVDKRKLEGAPRFAHPAEPDWTDPDFNRRVYGHYGYSYPYPRV